VGRVYLGEALVGLWGSGVMLAWPCNTLSVGNVESLPVVGLGKGWLDGGLVVQMSEGTVDIDESNGKMIVSRLMLLPSSHHDRHHHCQNASMPA